MASYLAAGISILGGAAKGFARKDQLESEAESIQTSIQRLDQNGKLLLAALASKGKKVSAKQEAAFAASGVDFSGTALDVVVDTQNRSMDEQLAAKSDLDAKRTDLAIKRAVAESESSFAVMQGILGSATQYASSEIVRTADREALISAMRKTQAKDSIFSSDDIDSLIDDDYSIIDERS